jgi:hypothetical protein
MAIKISVSGLAQFMNATSFSQRRLLRDYKFPFTKDGKRKPQIVRYSEASANLRFAQFGGDERYQNASNSGVCLAEK